MAMAYTQAERKLVLLACCFAGFITPLLSTMMNLSLVNIGQEFSAGSHQLAYVNTAFLLSSVVFMVPMAKVGNIVGKKRTFMAGVIVIAVASFVAPFSPSFWFLIGCRAIMGLGSACIVTTSISMITDVYPPEHRGGAIGLQTMCVYIGLAAGPVVGGLLNDAFGWHSLFFVIVPIAVVAVVCMSAFKSEIRPEEGGRMDSRGSVLYGVGILLAMAGLINLPETWAYVSLVIGIVVIGVFVWWQLRVPYHLLNVRLFKGRVFSGSCLATFMNYASSYSISYFMALYLQSIGALTATQAGMLMLVQPAIQAVLTPYFGRLSDRLGDKRILPTAGMVVSAVGIATIMTYGTEADLVLVVVTQVIIGFGFSMFSAPNTSIIMGSVEPKETSEASAMVAVMRQTGMMLSMGVAMLFISVIMGSADNLAPETYDSFITVMRYSFGVCVAMCLVGAVVSMFRGKGSVEAN